MKPRVQDFGAALDDGERSENLNGEAPRTWSLASRIAHRRQQRRDAQFTPFKVLKLITSDSIVALLYGQVAEILMLYTVLADRFVKKYAELVLTCLETQD